VALPTYVGSTVIQTSTVDLTPNTTGLTIAADDVLLLACESENQAIVLGTANGWAEVTNSPQSAGTAGVDPASRLAVFWKRATDAAPTMPTITDPGNHVTAAVHQFAGCITSGNPWDVTAGGNDGGVDDTSGVIPGATTTVIDCLVVAICTSSVNATSTTHFSAWTNADLGSLTERFDSINTVGFGGGHGMATGTKAGIGAYADTTVTLGGTSFKGAMSIALKPPVAGGATEWGLFLSDSRNRMVIA